MPTEMEAVEWVTRGRKQSPRRAEGPSVRWKPDPRRHMSPCDRPGVKLLEV
jgi:hypothetical protein